MRYHEVTSLRLLHVCRYDISQHPEVERKVVEELDQLGLLATPERPIPRSLEFADLSRLTYLNCVIKVCTEEVSLDVHDCACRPPVFLMSRSALLIEPALDAHATIS